jgi:hypothetical protein
MRIHDKLNMLRPPKSHTARVHVRLQRGIRASDIKAITRTIDTIVTISVKTNFQGAYGIVILIVSVDAVKVVRGASSEPRLT